MFNKRVRSEFGVRFRRKQLVHTALTAVFILILAVLASLVVFKGRNRRGNEQRELTGLYESGAYDRAFALSGEGLADKPLDYFLLVVHGFSSYQLALAQINSFDTINYLDGCIWALRKALISREGAGEGRVYYVLGKAYYYKGPAYADLAVEYLEKARGVSYYVRDIPEYLGLAYAALRDYRNSVAAFTLALNPGEGAVSTVSDILLLAIAQSYAALDELDAARAYLLRCVESSRDFDTAVAARLLLADVLKKTGDLAAAEVQYLAIIDGDGENAEAHYRLGEVYLQRGDEIHARAEWRRAYKIDPAHRAVRERLNM